MNRQIGIKIKYQISCFIVGRILPILFVSINLLHFSSCRQLVQDEFSYFESTPTINSILVEGKPLSICASLTEKLDTTSLLPINNATIDLYIDGKFGEQLKYSEDGIYNTNTIIKPETEYKCQIIIQNKDTIVCSQNLPIPTPILSVEHINIAGRDQEGTTFPAIRFSFHNDIKEKRYYEVVIKYFLKNQFINGLKQRFAWLQTISDPVLLNEGLPIALFSNEILEDSIYTMTLNYSTGGSSSRNGGPFRMNLYPFVVELRSVTYDYYRYQKQYYLYNEGRWADGLTNTTPPSPLYSNIENGYGIFAGYSVFVSDTITPEPYDD